MNQELIRQMLRWIGLYLVTLGLPAPVAALFEDPQVVQLATGLVSYALAELWWGASKVRK